MKKKVLSAIAALALLASILAGCGQKAVCDFCGEEKKCETGTMLGEEIHICGACQDELEGLVG